MRNSAICIALLLLKMHLNEVGGERKKKRERKKYFYVRTEEVTLGFTVD